jgi:hypothetical protein
MALKWWPTLSAIALAGFIALDMSGANQLAPVLAASGLVYLGAAAFGRPSTAWPLFFGTFIVITAAKFGLTTIDPTWILFGLAALLVAYGLVRGAVGLPLQTIAIIAFGTTAAIALVVGNDLGAYLVAAGLLGHAAWDVHHHRINKVVTRSMAEFCCVLDSLLAVVIVVATLRS